MPPELMPSLWPAVYVLATGRRWPPQTSADAEAFVVRANSESLLPLLAEAEMPELVRDAIDKHRALLRAHAMRATLIERALKRVGTLMEGEAFILLKGSDFAYRLYPNTVLRPMADIDILVPEGSMERVAAVLESRGLKRQYPAGVASRTPSHHEAVFSVGDVTFEVHHRFIQRGRHRIDYDGIWRRAVPASTPRFDALRLSDEDAFAYATISITLKYFAGPLIRYVDLWLMLRSNSRIAGDAAEVAASWMSRHAFYAALRFGSRMFPEFGTAQFEELMARVLDSRRRRFLDRFVIPTPPVGPKTVPSRMTQLWQKFWLMDSFARRSAFAAEHAAATVKGHLR